MNELQTVWFRVPLNALLVDDFSLQSLHIWRHNMRLSVHLEGTYLGGTRELGPWD